MAIPCPPSPAPPASLARALGPDRPPRPRLDGRPRGVRHAAPGEPRAGLGVAALPPARSASPLFTVVFVLGAGLGFLPTYAQSILGGWVFGVAARPARRPRRLHRRRPPRLPGRAARVEGPRRGADRGQPEGPRHPRRARRAGAVADAAGRGAPPAAAELALRAHQPGHGDDRRAAPRLRRRDVPRHAAAHRGRGRARRRRRRRRGRRTSRPSCATGGRGSSRPASWGAWPCSASSARSPAARCDTSRPDPRAPRAARDQVVREAIRDFGDRTERLSERERQRLLEAFDRLVPAIPPRAKEVDRELAALRRARRAGGRLSGGGRG